MELKVSISKSFIAFFTFVIFFIPISVGSITLLNEPIFILAFFSSVIYFFLNKKTIDQIELSVLLVGFLFAFLFYIILFIFLPKSLVIKDAVEPIKPLIYAFILLAGYTLSKHVGEKEVIKYVIIVTIITILFSSLVFIQPLHPFMDMFKGRPSTESFNVHFFRFSGTLGYPGIYGYWLVFSSLVTLLAYYKRQLSFQSFLIIYALIFGGILLTGSRGALIIYFLTTPFFLLLTINYKKTWLGILLIIILFLPAFIYMWFNLTESYSISYLRSGFEAIGESSFGHRMREIEMLFTSLKEGNLIGNGPNNIYIQEILGPVESVYFFYGYKFGLIGLSFYFLILLINIILFVREMLKRNLSLVFIFSVWVIVTLSGGAISTSVTEEYKSFFIFFLLFGYVLGIYKKNKKPKIFYSQNPL